jgi:hypothetical protein
VIDFDTLVLQPCMETFGETVTYLPSDNAPVTLTGEYGAVFNDKYADSKFQDGAEVVSTRPMISMRASALPRDPWQGELFRIRGVLYAIVEPPESDTFGDLRIFLRVATDLEALRAPLPPS